MADRAIRDLRFPVTIALRVQAASGESSIEETYTDVAKVHAGILPLGPMTFVASEQTDRPVTHKVIIRWLDWIDQRHVILRRTLRRDNSVREEVFRIVRAAEDEGMKRFLELLCQLEQRE